MPEESNRDEDTAASLRWRLRYAWWVVRDHLRGWWRNAKETTLDG